MPRIHDIAVPIFLDPIPVAVPRPVELLRRPGMAGASVLFHARQFDPLTIRTISSAPDRASAFAMAQRFIRLLRKRVRLDDGLTYAEQTVVLSVSSLISNGGMIIGGNGASDRWTVNATWSFLLDADYDQA